MDSSNLISYNPANGEPVGSVKVTSLHEIGAIVERASQAQRDWAALSLAERKSKLLPFAARLEGKLEELSILLTSEMGKPLTDARAEIQRASLPFAEYLSEIESALQPEQVQDKYSTSTIYYSPLGVCAVISPWNFPFYMPHWMIIPALMAGNPVVLKPSEETPLIAQAYVDIMNESLPEGVLQIVHGDEEQGKALVQARVQMIAFTGSREAGKHIMAAASTDLKRLVLELGGKDPLIVLDDADLELAARNAVTFGFRNAGQVCVSVERIFVDQKVLPEFQRKLLQFLDEKKVGAGTEEGVFIGPIINQQHRARILEQVERALAEGAEIAGGQKQHPERFLLPMVLTRVNPAMEIMQQETFGPVVCLMPFETIEQAIELANDSPFGLGASVFGKNLKRAEQVALKIHAGMTGINQSCYGAKGTPWVGVKQSGYGFHSGIAGHRQFAQTRVVSKPRQ